MEERLLRARLGRRAVDADALALEVRLFLFRSYDAAQEVGLCHRLVCAGRDDAAAFHGRPAEGSAAEGCSRGDGACEEFWSSHASSEDF